MKVMIHVDISSDSYIIQVSHGQPPFSDNSHKGFRNCLEHTCCQIFYLLIFFIPCCFLFSRDRLRAFRSFLKINFNAIRSRSIDVFIFRKYFFNFRRCVKESVNACRLFLLPPFFFFFLVII